MPIEKERLLKALKEVRGQSKPRKFLQSIDLMIKFTGIDLKKAENRISEEIELPHEPGGQKKVAVFAGGELAVLARKGGADLVLSKDELESLTEDPKRAKKIAEEHDFFIAQSDFMVQIGKLLGKILGPKGKMPKPLPSTADPSRLIARYKKTVKAGTREHPIIQTKIGTENMSDDELADNINTVLDVIERRVEEKSGAIDFICLKTTMGKPVKVK